MKTRFRFITEKCAACYACMIACMDQNDTDVESGGVPMRTVDNREGEDNGNSRVYGVTRGCLHCEKPVCIPACRFDCLHKDSETGMVLSDGKDCVACRNCANACPHDAIFFGADGKIIKCDGCVERVRHGMEPACTRVCPTDALLFAAD